MTDETGRDRLTRVYRASMARIAFIDGEIAGGKYPNQKKLARNYECSIATIGRDLDFMRDQLDAPIEYDAQRRGYYYCDKTYRVPLGFSGSRDMAALAVVKSFLSQYSSNPVYDAVQHLLDTITVSFENEKDIHNKTYWAEKRIVSPSVASVPVDDKLWKTLIKALRTNRVTEFDYQGGWDDTVQRRCVEPYQLLFDSAAWYLYCFDEMRKARRIFSLARMCNVKITDTRFLLPSDYDYCTKNKHSYFGVFEGPEDYEFSVNFYGWAAVEIKERIWIEGQIITEIDEGINIKFKSAQYGKVLEWVLAKGMYAKPLGPERLVDDWHKNVEIMAGKQAADRRELPYA
jgi:predicted DNA-binding transcriptional regulator YafY